MGGGNHRLLPLHSGADSSLEPLRGGFEAPGGPVRRRRAARKARRGMASSLMRERRRAQLIQCRDGTQDQRNINAILELAAGAVDVDAASNKKPATRDLSSSFFTHRFFPSSSQSSRRLRQAFVPDTLSYPLGGTYQPSWQVADMGTMYRKRASQPKKAPRKEQQCQLEGEICLFSNGLLGGAVKLPCCPSSSCVFTGERYQCVQDYSEYDQIELRGEQE